MAEEPENLTIRLLQEMRNEMREMREELTHKVDDLTNRVDGNTLILNMLAGMLHEHEHRLRAVEGR